MILYTFHGFQKNPLSLLSGENSFVAFKWRKTPDWMKKTTGNRFCCKITYPIANNDSGDAETLYRAGQQTKFKEIFLK